MLLNVSHISGTMNDRLRAVELCNSNIHAASASSSAVVFYRLSVGSPPDIKCISQRRIVWLDYVLFVG